MLASPPEAKPTNEWNCLATNKKKLTPHPRSVNKSVQLFDRLFKSPIAQCSLLSFVRTEYISYLYTVNRLCVCVFFLLLRCRRIKLIKVNDGTRSCFVWKGWVVEIFLSINAYVAQEIIKLSICCFRFWTSNQRELINKEVLVIAKKSASAGRQLTCFRYKVLPIKSTIRTQAK